MDPQSTELLHHYINTVYLTIANHKSVELWRTELPRMGIEQPFLMHGTLAVSALHLSRVNPSRYREMLSIATQEEQLALPNFRKLIARNDQRDIHAIFGFSGLVFIYILGSTMNDKCADHTFELVQRH